MADLGTIVDYETVIPASWLQDVNDLVYSRSSTNFYVPTLIVPFNAGGNETAVWFNMPLAEALFPNGGVRFITKVDLTRYSQCRLLCTMSTVPAAAGAVLALRYSPNAVLNVGNFNTDIGTTAVEVACDSADTITVSNWTALAAGAKNDVYLAVVGSGGNGATDPGFASVTAQFR